MFAAIFQGILVGIDYVVLIVFSEIKLPLEPEHILVVMISKMLLFACVIIIKKKWDHENFFNALTDSEWLRFLYFPVATIIIFILMIFYLPEIENTEIVNLIIIIALCLIGMNMLVLNLISDIVDREQRLQENNIFEERVMNQKKMYKVITDNYEKE